MFTGWMLFLMLNQQCQSTEGPLLSYDTITIRKLFQLFHSQKYYAEMESYKQYCSANCTMAVLNKSKILIPRKVT